MATDRIVMGNGRWFSPSEAVFWAEADAETPDILWLTRLGRFVLESRMTGRTTREPLIKPIHGLDQVARQNAVSSCSTDSMAYAIESGGTSLCRAREALNQSFPSEDYRVDDRTFLTDQEAVAWLLENGHTVPGEYEAVLQGLEV